MKPQVKYKPKSSHPWKHAFQPGRESYSDSLYEKPKPKISKPPKVFITEIMENWENIEVLSTYKKFGDKKELISSLEPSKQVAWFINLLRKAYVGGDPLFNDYD